MERPSANMQRINYLYQLAASAYFASPSLAQSYVRQMKLVAEKAVQRL